MQTVNTFIAVRTKKWCYLTPVGLLTGCSLSPSIPVIGTYYPSWLFCIIASVILTMMTRKIASRRQWKVQPNFPAVIYTALFALYAMLFWLIFF